MADSREGGSDLTAEDYKAAGNDLIKQGKYAEAADKYTQAIDLSPENHIYYSNRAIAYSALKQWDKTLADASKCISVNNTFRKGHSLKVKSLINLQRWAEAVTACQNALTQFPEDNTFIAWKKKSEANVVSFSQYITADRWALIIALVQIFMLVNVVIYLVPFTPALKARSCFKMAVFGSIALTILHTARTHGKPKLDMQYAEALMTDPYVQRVFLAAIAAQGRPYAVMIVPIFIHDLVNLAIWVRGLGHILLPGLTASITNAWLSSSVCKGIFPNLGAQSSPYLKRLYMWEICERTASGAEVSLALFRIGELFTPQRVIFLTILQVQYLQVRYAMSSYSQATWQKVHQMFTAATTHRYCPAFIDSVYQKFASMLYNFANRANQAAQQAQATQEQQQ